MDTHLRPWQGTLLGVLAWISFGSSVLGIIMTLFFQGMFASLIGGIAAEQDGGGIIMGLLGGAMIFTAVMFGAFAVFYYFYARGLMNGRKWTLILSVILSGLSTLVILLGFLSSLELGAFVSLVVTAFFLYLPASILKHPFYNRAK